MDLSKPVDIIVLMKSLLNRFDFAQNSETDGQPDSSVVAGGVHNPNSSCTPSAGSGVVGSNPFLDVPDPTKAVEYKKGRWRVKRNVSVCVNGIQTAVCRWLCVRLYYTTCSSGYCG